MNNELWRQVDAYIAQTFHKPDPALDAALKSSADADLPAISVSPNQGKLLALLAQIHGARRILEIGTLGGYSTIWLARTLPKTGCLTTLEFEPKNAEIARENVSRAGLADVVEFRIGKALETLPQLFAEKREPFDFIFIDADKENYAGYFEWALKLSRPGTVIIADNVVRNGAVIDPGSDDPRVQGVRRFNELVAAEPRVDATAIQTVGSKGYDGFVIAVVTGD